MSEQRRFLVIGAHPDDCDILFGGTAIKMKKAGNLVKFVSACNGDCGHHVMGRKELAERRYGETQASARIAGLAEYQVLDNHDCQLVANLALREEIIRIIRRFQPDVVLSHRLCDYHADHRNIAQAVMDAAYLVKVPHYCEDTPIPAKNPVFAYVFDRFTDPRPIRADAAVDIDSVFEDKLRMLDCHVSQFYEWLPWDKGFRDFDADKMTWAEKRAWLESIWGKRNIVAADMGRDTLVKSYGEAGKSVKHAEIFEFSPYGEAMELDDFRKLFL